VAHLRAEVASDELHLPSLPGLTRPLVKQSDDRHDIGRAASPGNGDVAPPAALLDVHSGTATSRRRPGGDPTQPVPVAVLLDTEPQHLRGPGPRKGTGPTQRDGHRCAASRDTAQPCCQLGYGALTHLAVEGEGQMQLLDSGQPQLRCPRCVHRFRDHRGGSSRDPGRRADCDEQPHRSSVRKAAARRPPDAADTVSSVTESPPDRGGRPEPAQRAEPAQRPEVAPVEVDSRPVIAAGTIAWLIALVLLATVFHHTLARHHATWWLWSCGIGAVLGGYGYSYVSRRVMR